MSRAPQLWTSFSARLLPLLGLIALGLAFVVAALAPLLANERPWWIDDAAGERSFPILAALGKSDLSWLLALASALLGWIVGRLNVAQGRSPLIVGLISGAALFAIGLPFARSAEAQFDPRHYRLELGLRRELAELDREANPSAETLKRLSNAASVSIDLSIELEQRRKGADLRERNRSELAKLEAAVFAPCPWHAETQDLDARNRAPGSELHPLGTDERGRDLVARLVHGCRRALEIAVGAVILASLLGLVVGLIAGVCGPKVDWCLSRMIESVMALPALVLLLLFSAYLPNDRPTMILIFASILWTQPARLVRAEARRVAKEPFLLAARAIGASPLRRLLRHALPHCLTPLLVCASLEVATVILAESALAFLGIGDRSPGSWGAILADARSDLGRHWHLALGGGAAIFFVVLAANLVGDGLRAASDPRQRLRVTPTNKT